MEKFNFWKKLSILLALMVTMSLSGWSQCDYTLKMIDSYGDGWNGNTMDVLVNGTVVIDSIELQDPPGDVDDTTFAVNPGDNITTVWNGGGSYGGETSYEILNSDGIVVGSGAESDISTPIVASCPTCPAPTAIASSNVTDNSADISWTSSAANTNLEWGTAGFTPGSGTYVSDVSNPYTISGLTATTPYDVYVQDSCSSTDVSVWKGPITFTTSAALQSLPFTDGFEGTLDAWSFTGSGTPATTTSEVYEGSQSLELVGTTGDDASATISFNASTGSPRLTFAYYIESSYSNEFSVDIQESGSSSWTEIYVFDGSADTWIYEELNLDTLNTTSGSFKIRMNAENTSSWYTYEVYVDAFEIYVPADNDLMASDIYLPLGAGIEMTNSTDVGLEIYNNGVVAQSGYNVSYTVDGGSFVTENVSATIDPDTTHQHAFAATADLSSYGMHEIKAVVANSGDTVNYNDTITKVVYNHEMPYVQSFDSLTEPEMPKGWQVLNPTSDGIIDSDDYEVFSGSMAMDIDNNGLGDGEVLMAIMPPFYGSFADKRLKFAGFNEDLNEELIIGILSDPTDTATFTPIDTVNFIAEETWEQKQVDFFNYSGSGKYIAFKHNCSETYTDFYIDDVELTTVYDNDVSVISVDEPIRGGIDMTSSMPVTIKVKNEGKVSQSSIPVMFSTDSGATYTTETIAGPLSPNDTATYTFTGTADLSTIGDQQLITATGLATDQKTRNDTLHTLIQNFTIPYTQNFDSVTEPALPAGWSFNNESEGYVETSDSEAKSAPYSLDIYNSSSSGGETLMAILPVYYGNISDKWITMDIYSETTDDSLIVGVLDNPQDASTFTGVDTIIFPDNDVWGAFYADLTGYTGTGQYIAFKHTSTETYSDMFIDNLVLETIPSGPIFAFDADTLDMGNKVRYNFPDTTTKTISFSNKGYGGMDVTNVTISGTHSNNFDVVDTNTYPKTLNTYESLSLQVEFIGDTEGAKSASLDVTTNTTTNSLPIVGEVVDVTIDSFPYLESFEHNGDFPFGWLTTSNDGDFTWEIDEGETGSSSTGPDGDHTTGNGYYAYSEATGADSADIAILKTPLIDLSSLSNPKMNFWYHMYGEDIDTLAIDIATGGSWNYNAETIVGEQHSSISDPWTMHTIDLTSYSSADSIQFRVIRGADYKGDVSIDDIAFGEDLNIDLGPDTVAICDGSTTTLDAGHSSGWTYEWYVDTMDMVASTSQNITVDSAAKYYVKVTDIGGFTGIDSVVVNVNPSPSVDVTTKVGPVYCASAAVDTLVGTPAGGSYSGNGVSGNTFDPTIAGAGQHTVYYTYTNSYGCSATDSIMLKVNPLPVVDAGADQEVCKGDSVTLTATYNNLFFSEYIEGSGDNKAIEFYNGTGKTVNLNNFALLTNYNGKAWSGEYTFPAGATLNHGETYVVANKDADSTILNVADETLGFSDKGYMMGYNGNDVRALVQYAPNGDTIIIDQIGRYDMVDPGNGWDVAGVTDGTSEHTLIRKPNAVPNLGGWDASAATDSISSEWYVMPQDDFSDLGTHTTNLSNKAYASVSYLWSNGATTESITVAPTSDHQYTVTLTDAMGCTNVDTVNVTVNDLPTVDLGADTMFVCAADTATLYAGDFDAYSWSTGETTDSVMVDSSGIGLGSHMITVSVTDSLGCMNTDTVVLSFVDYPSVTIAGPDTFKYYTETATYDVGAGFASYLWSTGATTQDITIDSSDVTMGTNTISVTVTNDYGCETTESKDIYVDDDSGIEDRNDNMHISVYPNPNAGVFTLEINGPKEDFNLEIMNVNGQLIQSEQINTDKFSKQYDLSNLSGGIYYIRLINEDMTKTQKLIIR